MRFLVAITFAIAFIFGGFVSTSAQANERADNLIFGCRDSENRNMDCADKAEQQIDDVEFADSKGDADSGGNGEGDFGEGDQAAASTAAE